MKFSLRRGLFRVCVLITIGTGISVLGGAVVTAAAPEPDLDLLAEHLIVCAAVVAVTWVSYNVVLYLLGGFFPPK